MSKVGIVAYGTTPFTKDDHKIESILHKSTNDLFQKNPKIDKKEIDAVLISTNNNSKYLSPILSEMSGIQPKIAHSLKVYVIQAQILLFQHFHTFHQVLQIWF